MKVAYAPRALRDIGPALPVEFSRISRTREGALTLVIDPAHGPAIPVAWTLSRRHDIDLAIEDLRRREGTSSDNIGYIHRNGQRARFPQVAHAIGGWMATRDRDGAVWTDLPSNFHEQTAVIFSIENARAYLDRLTESGKVEARRYIQNTPAFVDTPLRRALADAVI